MAAGRAVVHACKPPILRASPHARTHAHAHAHTHTHTRTAHTHTHTHQDVDDAPKRMGPDALLRSKEKQKRFRDGYEAGISTTRLSGAAAAFVSAPAPVEVLGRISWRVCAVCV